MLKFVAVTYQGKVAAGYYWC